MPGVQSLQAAEYYAHPRNAFWKIMGELVGADPELGYQQRCRCLTRAGIALWDVMQACVRPGSLDQKIDESSIVVNDFNAFLTDFPSITHVFFNGGKAEQAWRRYVKPGLDIGHSLVEQRLPSTSPAHAAMSFDQKLARWEEVVRVLSTRGPA
jgi:hypoxanthine-DNA glycosylase